jgi:hypothetical protein
MSAVLAIEVETSAESALKVLPWKIRGPFIFVCDKCKCRHVYQLRFFGPTNYQGEFYNESDGGWYTDCRLATPYVKDFEVSIVMSTLGK